MCKAVRIAYGELIRFYSYDEILELHPEFVAAIKISADVMKNGKVINKITDGKSPAELVPKNIVNQTSFLKILNKIKVKSQSKFPSKDKKETALGLVDAFFTKDFAKNLPPENVTKIHSLLQLLFDLNLVKKEQLDYWGTYGSRTYS